MSTSAPPIVTAKEHYESLLAEHYTWMCGPYDAKVAQQRETFARLGVSPGPTGEALDLGCGSGFQSIALAQLGFRVTAIDANQRLLAELALHRGDLPVSTVVHDLCDLRTCGELPSSADLAVCMGDTLTHLPSHAAVSALFVDVARVLAPGGTFILAFRDMSHELRGLDRFIPVRSDEDRIMTCFLQYEAHSVIVHDLIYLRNGSGDLHNSSGGAPQEKPAWTLRKSAYRKLRLSIEGVSADLENAGFQIRSQEQALGMWTAAARLAT